MNIPKLDERKEEDIFNQIRNLARQYVPEWNFDDDDPDFGVIFSKVFSAMFIETITKYNDMPYNHYIEFLNVIGAKVLHAIPSNGMITVNLQDGVEGKFIKRGEYVYGVNEEGMDRILYKTKEAMFTIKNRIKSVIVTDGSKDVISKIYDSEKSGCFYLFDSISEENLQKHEVYFENHNVFSTYFPSTIIINFYEDLSIERQNKLLSYFCDVNNVIWQYYHDGKWVNFEKYEAYEKNSIKLTINQENHLSKVNGVESYFIRALFFKIFPNEIKFTRVTCISARTQMSPEGLTCNTDELACNNFFPFGEQYTIYNSFYIASKAFNKKGASIEVSMNIKFLEIEKDKVTFGDSINYRNIMKGLDFEGPPNTDTEIERVEWEYWNGSAWTRIYKEHEYEDAFNRQKIKSSVLKFNFICPQDMEETSVGSMVSKAIRVRISKIKNPLSMNSFFITPFIENISVSYNYDKPQEIKEMFVCSNTIERKITLEDKLANVIFKKTLEDDPITYFCLEEPINKAPVKILFNVNSNRIDSPSIIWQYASKDSKGDLEWRPISILDLTYNFKNSGIITVIGNDDFLFTELFGERGYFIRLVNKDKLYSKVNKLSMLPQIFGVRFNTVFVEQIEDMAAETFMIEKGEVNKECSLSRKNIVDVCVYINEINYLTSNEKEEFFSQKDTKIISDDEGRIIESWIKWREVKNIKIAKQNERVYEVDYSQGKVIFGDGRFGKIPTSQKQESIRIEYKTSEGSLGNIKEGEIINFYENIDRIESVENVKPMVGGADKETVEECLNRSSKQIPGVGRIVSIDDFEDQIICHFRNIYKIKCMPHVDRFDNESFGIISVAVLPKKIMQGHEQFMCLENMIGSFLKDKVSLNLIRSSKICVFEVEYVKIFVDIDGIITGYDSYQSVNHEVVTRLENFLNPISGNYNNTGWNIGSIPRKDMIRNYIRDIPDLKYIKNINIFYKIIVNSKEKYVEEELLNKKNFVVPVFGEAKINLSIDG